MLKIRKFINKLKKSANVQTQDSTATLEVEEQEQERFEEDAAATILSLLRHKPESEILKPYYMHDDFNEPTLQKTASDLSTLKKDLPVEHANSLMDILKGVAIKKDPIIRTQSTRSADVKDLLRILKHSPVPNSDEEDIEDTPERKPSPFKFDLKVINDLLDEESE